MEHLQGLMCRFLQRVTAANKLAFDILEILNACNRLKATVEAYFEQVTITIDAAKLYG